ncbi:MAG: NAD(P)/FAD-dependent oxidoreductase [Anaerolineales bacterium]|nr:NAD(P)/FAD-dependent oxidoreductase [Anaerolineales bacterium]
MDEKRFDVVVIGGGPAGLSAVSKLNDEGYQVCLIERNRLGGTCLNYGCDPTKTLLYTAQQFHEIPQLAERGIHTENVSLDWERVQQHVAETLRAFRGGSEEDSRNFWRERGVEVVIGEAHFTSADTVCVDNQTITAERFVIATGTTAVVPNIPGLKETGYITNQEAIYLPELPHRLAIVGAGPIGVEFAQMFSRFDVKVTLIEAVETILPLDDEDLTQELARLLKREGVSLKLNTKLKAVEQTAEGKTLTLETKDGQTETLTADEILLAVGRQSVLPALNPQAAGLELDDDNWLVVDECLRSSTPHIWGMGDVLGGAQFTGVAEFQGQHVAANLFAADPEPLPQRPIPWVTFTSPALAHLGQTEQQVQEAGTPYRVARFEMSDAARAKTKGQAEGLVKLLVNNDDKLLGAHILAHNAGDLLGPLVVMMNNDLPLSALTEAIFPYPTMVEAVPSAAEAVE